MQVLFISNGAGEDCIAANVAESLRDLGKDITCRAFPLLGAGNVYKSRGIEVVNESEMPPSGGFVRSIQTVVKDVFGGAIGQQLRNRRLLRKWHRTADVIVAVGDVFCLGLAGKGFSGPVVFMPTAKSDRFMPHSALEVAMIKRMAQLVLPRDKETASSLCGQGVNAVYCGNPMMDKLKVTGSLSGVFKKQGDVVALIPGSRSEALGNLKCQLDVVVALCEQGLQAQFVLGKAPSIGLSDIKLALEHTAWHATNASDQVRLVHSKTGVEVLVSEAFADVIDAATWCLGMAGTANEQAAHYGRFVYTFVGTGPQSSERRLREQEQLMGRERIRFLPGRDANGLAAQLLADLSTRERPVMTSIGYETEASVAAAELIAKRA